MKKNILIMSLVIFCFSKIAGYAENEKIEGYIGLKSGTFALERNSLNIFSLGGTGGCTISFGNRYIEVGLEGDFNLGYFGGDYVSGCPGNRAHIRTLGVYGVVRTIPVNEIYMKGKVGFTSETLIKRIENLETLYKETGLSFGIGVGYNASDHVNVEAEFATTNSDMKFFSIILAFVF
jgi:outer membrane immunogenic protein